MVKEKDEAAIRRRNIERYQSLLAFLRDPQMRETIQKLLKEAEERLNEITQSRKD